MLGTKPLSCSPMCWRGGMLKWVFLTGFRVFNTSAFKGGTCDGRVCCGRVSRECSCHRGSWWVVALQRAWDEVFGCGPSAGPALEPARKPGGTCHCPGEDLWVAWRVGKRHLRN